jgi:hypothetical protein
MKLLYKLFAVLFVFAAVNTNAQQLTTPMDLRVSAPANIASSFNYGYQSDWGASYFIRNDLRISGLGF